MTAKSRKTSDALEILYRRYYQGKPKRIAMLRQAHINDDVARQIREMREQAGLSQRQLAARVGTTPAVISQLEEADCGSHSLSMFERIAEALGKQLDIRFRNRRQSKTA